MLAEHQTLKMAKIGEDIHCGLILTLKRGASPRLRRGDVSVGSVTHFSPLTRHALVIKNCERPVLLVMLSMCTLFVQMEGRCQLSAMQAISK